MRFARLFLALALMASSVSRAQLASPYSISLYKAQTFTASGQTGAAIPLNGLTASSSTVGSSFVSGTITVTGSSLTTVTFGVQGSADNGATYYAVPISAVTSPGSTHTTVTASAAGLYQISLAGLTHVRFVTSGTFTATNVTLTLSASPNAVVSGGAAIPAITCGAGSYINGYTPGVGFTCSSSSGFSGVFLDTATSDPYTLAATNGQMVVSSGGSGGVAGVCLNDTATSDPYTLAATNGQMVVSSGGSNCVASLTFTDTSTSATRTLVVTSGTVIIS